MTERRRALVTGAARGIGAAIAARLGSDGFEVLTLDLDDGCDITLDVAHGEFPPLTDIDVCVANAGVTRTIAPAHRMTPEQWQLDIDVNLTGAFRTIQACLGGMRERRHGRIVVVSSVAALGGLPGLVGTEAVLAMPAEIQERALAAAPSGRLVEPAEIAALVGFLAGEQAAQISGQTIAVDGGASLNQMSLARSGV